MDLRVSGHFGLCHSWSTRAGILSQTLWPLAYSVDFLFMYNNLEPSQIHGWHSVRVGHHFFVMTWQLYHQYLHLPQACPLASSQPFPLYYSKSQGKAWVRVWWGSEGAIFAQVPLPAEGYRPLSCKSSVWPWVNHISPLVLSSLFIRWILSALDPSGLNLGCCGFLSVSLKRIANGLRSLGKRNLCFPQNISSYVWGSVLSTGFH